MFFLKNQLQTENIQKGKVILPYYFIDASWLALNYVTK